MFEWCWHCDKRVLGGLDENNLCKKCAREFDPNLPAPRPAKKLTRDELLDAICDLVRENGLIG